MKGHHPPSQQNGAQAPPPQAGALFNLDAQENIANIIKMATKIISNAPYLGMGNSTMDGEDYFDSGDNSDISKSN